MLRKLLLKKYVINNKMNIFFLLNPNFAFFYFSRFYVFLLFEYQRYSFIKKNNRIIYKNFIFLHDSLLNNKFYINFVLNIFNYFFFLIFFFKYNFTRFMFFVSVGLGFKRKRKIKYKRRFLELYVGNRHRILCKLSTDSYLVLLKRSVIYFFSNLKKNIKLPVIKFRTAKHEAVFKIKGFFFNRFKISKVLARTWAFARRVRFKKIKAKLSKKQKLL